MTYIIGKEYDVVDQNGAPHRGTYTGRETGAGVIFDVFQTQDRIPGQPGLAQVLLVAGEIRNTELAPGLDSGPRTAKQVIVIRRDLKMRRGKEIAQGAHASMAWLSQRVTDPHALPVFSQAEWAWLSGGTFTKVTCQVPDLEALLAVHEAALSQGVLCRVIRDAGLTEFSGIPMVTALAVGPDWSDVVDQVTGGLTLY